MKKTVRDNYRLEVHPDLHGVWVPRGREDETYRQILRDIKKAILRHVDEVDRVDIKWDTHHTCSHCEGAWETLTVREVQKRIGLQDDHSIEGEPVCCLDAVNEFRTEHGIPLCST